MGHELHIVTTEDKAEKYANLLPQIKALVEGEKDLIANLANIAAALKYAMDFFWVGFYLVKGSELVLGPFQGPPACTRIGKGKGVCGTAWLRRESIIVDDVDTFPGHISCNSGSKSEIVLPIMHNNEVIMVLDVDSDEHAHFNSIDEEYLGEIRSLIQQKLLA